MEWKLLGKCFGQDTNIWFPENDRWAERRAKDICVVCPVRAQCMDHAIRHNEVGIWGGTSEKDRRSIRGQYVRPRKGLAYQPVSMV